MWLFKRKTETRSAMAAGYTAQIIAARESYVSGIAELTDHPCKLCVVQLPRHSHADIVDATIIESDQSVTGDSGAKLFIKGDLSFVVGQGDLLGRQRKLARLRLDHSCLCGSATRVRNLRLEFCHDSVVQPFSPASIAP